MKPTKLVVSPGLVLTLLFVAILLFFTATPLFAQVDTGSITGTVTDQSGAVVNGAKVTLTNEGTAVSLTTTTSADGNYTFRPSKLDRTRLTCRFRDSRRPRQAAWLSISLRTWCRILRSSPVL